MTTPCGEQAALLATGAALLDTGRAIAALMRPLTVLAFAALLVPVWLPTPPGCLPLLLAAAVFGLGGTYAGARVALDATLFRNLADADGAAASLDAAMVTLQMIPTAKLGRPLATRIAGARRLLRIQATLLVAQACALAATGIVRASGLGTGYL